MAFSLDKVGESITFSGLTVMAALSTVVIATFGLYQGFGPALAIGIAMALLANLTLLPALLAIFGRAVFWPRIPVAGPVKRGTWGRVAGRVVGRPVLTLVVGLVILGGPGAVACWPTRRPGSAARPCRPASDSAKGQALLAAHYPAAESDPTNVVFRLPDLGLGRPVGPGHRQQRPADLRPVLLGGIGPLDPNGTTPCRPDELAAAHAQLAAERSGGRPARRPRRRSTPGSPPPTTPTGRRGSSSAPTDGHCCSRPRWLPGRRPARRPPRPCPRSGPRSPRSAQIDRGHRSGVDGYAAVAADVGHALHQRPASGSSRS